MKRNYRDENIKTGSSSSEVSLESSDFWKKLIKKSIEEKDAEIITFNQPYYKSYFKRLYHQFFEDFEENEKKQEFLAKLLCFMWLVSVSIVIFITMTLYNIHQSYYIINNSFNYKCCYKDLTQFHLSYEELLKHSNYPKKSLNIRFDLNSTRNLIRQHLKNIIYRNINKPLILCVLTNQKQANYTLENIKQLVHTFSYNYTIIYANSFSSDTSNVSFGQFIHNSLNNKISKTLIIHDLATLSPSSALKLYPYCDNENSLVKYATFIFSIICDFDVDTLPNTYLQIQGLIDSTLKKSWDKNLSSNYLDPLLARLVDYTIIL